MRKIIIFGLCMILLAAAVNGVASDRVEKYKAKSFAFYPLNNNVSDVWNGYDGSAFSGTWSDDYPSFTVSGNGGVQSTYYVAGTDKATLHTDIGEMIGTNETFSIFTWVKLNETQLGQYKHIWYIYRANAINRMQVWDNSTVAYSFYINDGGAKVYWMHVKDNITDSTWHSLGVTFNKTTLNMSLWVDCKLDGTVTLPNSDFWGDNDRPTNLGNYYNDNEQMVGFVDEFMVFNATLDNTEVARMCEWGYPEALTAEYEVYLNLPVNNTYTNAAPITFSFNATLTSDNCSLTSNITAGSLNTTGEVLANTETEVKYTPPANTSEAIEFYVVCNRSGESANDSTTVHYDIFYPLITFDNPQFNGTVIGNNTEINISCTDDNLMDFEGLISIGSVGGQIYNEWHVLNTTTKMQNYSVFFTSNISATFFINTNCSDGHTKNDISDLYYSYDPLEKKIIYSHAGVVLSEKFAASNLGFNDITTSRKSDRITSSYSMITKGTGENYLTKEIECSVPFRELNMGYKGHLICGKMWYDNELEDKSARVSMQRLTPYRYLITTYSYSSKFDFKTVGIINTVYMTLFFELDLNTPTVVHLTANWTNFNQNQTFNLAYNTTDSLSDVQNCSLYFNGTYNATNTSITENAESLFSYTSFAAGNFSYYIACMDNFSNNGSSDLNYITILASGGAADDNLYNNTIVDITNWFNTDDLDTTTTSGVLLYFFISFIILAIIIYAEVTQIPVFYIGAGALTFFYSFLIFTKISAVIGIILFFITFIIMIRGIIIFRD